MPSDDFFDGYETPDDWSNTERELFDDLIDGDPTLGADETLQELFHDTFFEGHGGEQFGEALDALENYFYDEYDLLFDEYFDWDGYAEWYDATH